MRVISGAFGGRMLKTTSGSGYRPATDRVREALFSMLEHRGIGWENSRVMDVFAGSGSLGIEALSRGAGPVWFVEKNRRACRLITANLEAFGVDRNRYHIVARDAFSFLRSAPGSPFDLAFVDPPYGKDMLLPTLDLLLAHSWLGPNGLLVAELETGMSFEPDVRDGLDVLVDRTYGQTRICIWSRASIA